MTEFLKMCKPYYFNIEREVFSNFLKQFCLTTAYFSYIKQTLFTTVR